MENTHTYFVGRNNILVHNACGGDPANNSTSSTTKEGVVYKRTNPETGEGYVGQAKSPERFDARQGEHDKKLGVTHDYEVVGTAPAGKKLDAIEETQIRENGGLQKEGGTLANKRHQMSEKRYKEAGGEAENPKPQKDDKK